MAPRHEPRQCAGLLVIDQVPGDVPNTVMRN